MKLLSLLPAILFIIATACAGEPLSPQEWKYECRPEKKLSNLRIDENGILQFRRYAGAKSARLYHDTALEPGAWYSLTFEQHTEHGALDLLLIIFRGKDGKWREKTRLSCVTPLVNGEWTPGRIVLQTPPDVDLARVDFRLDSAGTLNLRAVKLEKIDAATGEAYRAALRPAPFALDRSPLDLPVRSDSYQKITFTAQGGESDGTVTVEFHDPTRGWINRSRMTIYIPAGIRRECREITLIPENVNGIRISPSGCAISNLKVSEFR